MILVLYDNDVAFEDKLQAFKLIKTFDVNHTCVSLYEIHHTKVLFAAPGYTKVQVSQFFGRLMGMFHINLIIGTGNCGALYPLKSPIFSVAITTESLQYDVDFSAIGHFAPSIPNVNQYLFKSQTKLINRALKSASDYHLPTSIGRFCSADQFVANKWRSEDLRTRFTGHFVDSECGIIGELAYFYQIQFIGVKVVSNYCGDLAGKDYERNSHLANELALKVILNMIEGF